MTTKKTHRNTQIENPSNLASNTAVLAVNGCKASLFMPGLVESFSAHWETHPRPTQSGSKMDFLSYIQLYFIVKKSFKEIQKKTHSPMGSIK